MFNTLVEIIIISACAVILSVGCNNLTEEIPSESSPKSSEYEKSMEKAPESIQVVADSSTVAVLVNKIYRLPDHYVPDDLVYPDVPFIFDEMIEKRKLRKEAAEALKKMFAAAKKDGIYLAGVSGYRSKTTQKSLFNNYVSRDGLEAANQYSARPGHSEHQTGLAMDVSGSTGHCAIEDCFANTEEARWLDKHAAEHGFIIRYPKGKESITGYKYEPWHIRYVGIEISSIIAKEGITLEEYYGESIPVINTIKD